MMEKPARNPGLWILMLLLAGLACGKGPSTQSRPLPPAIAQLKDQSGGETILRAMEAHGGWWAWREKETVEYDFDWTPYTGDGAPGMTSQEHHEFFLSSLTRMRVERPSDNSIMAFNGRVAWVTQSGIMSQDITKRAMAQAFLQRAFWIFRLPFNLVEKGVRLEDEGMDGDLQMVRIYFPVGMSVLPDDWCRAYFDRQTGLLRRLMMASGQGKNIIEFSDYREIDGIQIAHRRRIFRVLPPEIRGPQTHEVEIRNLKYNTALNADLFDPPELIRESMPPPPPAGSPPGS
ncbi:MAG: hypothetical protein V3T54_01100 [Acidobacteriota bacterium]